MPLSSWEAHRAIKENRINFIKKYFNEKHFDPNATFRGQSLLTTCVLCNSEQVLCLLLDLRANPNLKSDEGGRYETPMITAVKQKNLKLVKVLIDNGAKISATNYYGQDAIYQAVECNAFEILEYLICHPLSLSENNDHEPLVVCPFHLALTQSSYSLKKKSLLILIRFNYNCLCMKKLFERTYPKDEFTNSPHHKDIIVDSDILQWLYLGYSTFHQRVNSKKLCKVNESIQHCIKLNYLSRLAIRSISFKLAIKNQSSFVQIVQSFPLPASLIDFLLLKDVQFKK